MSDPSRLDAYVFSPPPFPADQLQGSAAGIGELTLGVI
jgi:hypothetical protein